MGIYWGNGGVMAVKEIYAGAGGGVKTVKEVYVGQDGVPELVWRKKSGCFVCVGEKEKSYYSTDGETWKAMSGLPSGTFNEVAYGNDRFVCVGPKGLSCYSTNGKTWVAMSGLDSPYIMNCVEYGNGRFVCVGNGGRSYYSTDGKTWVAMSGLPNANFYGVTYGGDA